MDLVAVNKLLEAMRREAVAVRDRVQLLEDQVDATSRRLLADAGRRLLELEATIERLERETLQPD